MYYDFVVKMLQRALFNFIRSSNSADATWEERVDYSNADIDQLKELINSANSEHRPNFLLLLDVKIKTLNLRKQLAKSHITTDFLVRYQNQFFELQAGCLRLQQNVCYMAHPGVIKFTSLLPIEKFNEVYENFIRCAKAEERLQYCLATFVTVKPIVGLTPLQKNQEEDFSSEVFLVTKKAKNSQPRDFYRWYWKKFTSASRAAYELITQELLRFFFYSNPKTRIGINENNEFGILSKEVIGYIPFRDITEEQKARFNPDDLLAFCVVVMTLVVDIDLRAEHLGFDVWGHMVKLDGGCGLSRINLSQAVDESKMRKDFTAKDINSLPVPTHFLPYNWLGYVENAVRTHVPEQPNDFQLNLIARWKMHYAILRTMLLPDAFFEIFVGNYIKRPALAATISNHLCDQRNTLIRTYVNDSGFKSFFFKIPNETIELQVMYAKSFLTTGKHCVIPLNSGIPMLMFARFHEMQYKLAAGNLRSLTPGAYTSNNRFTTFKKPGPCKRTAKKENVAVLSNTLPPDSQEPKRMKRK